MRIDPRHEGNRVATLNALAVVLAAGLLLAGGMLALRPLLRRILLKEELRQDSRPIPERWFSVLDQSVPIARHLGAPARTQLLRASRELIATRHWEGCGGLELDADMQLIIAAQACILTLSIPGEPFPGLREILVYPSVFVPRSVCDPRKWLGTEAPERPLPELGESWSQGVIVLAWGAAVAQAASPGDGHNVILHEFAHELAFEHDLIPPVLSLARREEPRPDVKDPGTWRRVLEESYERLCAKVEAQTPSVLDKYGATNQAEFFAVATEAFFERPGALEEEYRPLYEQLRGFYRQDPGAT